MIAKVNPESLVASDDSIHGFQNSAPDYADDYPMLGEINNVFSKLFTIMPRSSRTDLYNYPHSRLES